MVDRVGTVAVSGALPGCLITVLMVACEELRVARWWRRAGLGRLVGKSADDDLVRLQWRGSANVYEHVFDGSSADGALYPHFDRE